MTSRDTPQMTPGYWYDAKLRIASAANEYDLSYRDFFLGFKTASRFLTLRKAFQSNKQFEKFYLYLSVMFSAFSNFYKLIIFPLIINLRGSPNFDLVKYLKEVSHVKHMHANSLLILLECSEINNHVTQWKNAK